MFDNELLIGGQLRSQHLLEKSPRGGGLFFAAYWKTRFWCGRPSTELNRPNESKNNLETTKKSLFFQHNHSSPLVMEEVAEEWSESSTGNKNLHFRIAHSFDYRLDYHSTVMFPEINWVCLTVLWQVEGRGERESGGTLECFTRLAFANVEDVDMPLGWNVLVVNSFEQGLSLSLQSSTVLPIFGGNEKPQKSIIPFGLWLNIRNPHHRHRTADEKLRNDDDWDDATQIHVRIR